MTRPLVVLRPEPGARETAERAMAIGLDVIRMPLFQIEPVPYSIPLAPRFDAVLFTSANGVHHGALALCLAPRLPVFAVGKSTGALLQSIGLEPIIGGGTIATTLPLMAERGLREILHVCGEDVRPVDAGDLNLHRMVVYRAAERTSAAEEAVLQGLPPAVMLVHSPRAGQRLAALLGAAERTRHALVAISVAAAEAAGSGWGHVGVAMEPHDLAMLALVHKLCQDDAIGISGSTSGI